MRVLDALRAIIAWILTLTAGFAAFMLLATLVILPIEAAKNRAMIASVDRHAHRLYETGNLPRNKELGEGFTKTPEGVWVWPSLPGGCHDIAFEAPSDRFAIGFWNNGNGGRFGSTWWHCSAYPSRNTTLPLSVLDYLRSAAGSQLLGYALVAAVAGCLAFVLRPRRRSRNLRLVTKALWFGSFMTFTNLFYGLLDSGDDQYFRNPDSVKWFAFVYEKTVWTFAAPIGGPIYFLDELLGIGEKFGGNVQTIYDFGALFVIWSALGWVAGLLTASAWRWLAVRKLSFRALLKTN